MQKLSNCFQSQVLKKMKKIIGCLENPSKRTTTPPAPNRTTENNKTTMPESRVDYLMKARMFVKISSTVELVTSV